MPSGLRTFALCLAAVAASVAAQLLLKAAASRAAPAPAAAFLAGLFARPLVWAALAVYGAGLLLFFLVLRSAEVSWVGLVSSLGYVLMVLGGWGFFGEALTTPKLLGMGLIVAGVAVLSLK